MWVLLVGDKTNIEWTDSTWNPIRGCSRVSDGCMNCYAEKVANRFKGPGQTYDGLIAKGGQWNGKITLVPEKLLEPWRWLKPRRIFVNSMSDLFHESVPFEYIAAVFFIMSSTTRHTYQVLTKRPERMLEFFQWASGSDGGSLYDNDVWTATNKICNEAEKIEVIKNLPWKPLTKSRGGYDNCGPGWPYQNIWLGVSVENQKAADERIPLLLACPAAVRWISAEPLLGELDLAPYLQHPYNKEPHMNHCETCQVKAHWGFLDWVVAGGESGPGARPMNPEWIKSLRNQCIWAGVPFLFKQRGPHIPGLYSWLHRNKCYTP